MAAFKALAPLTLERDYRPGDTFDADPAAVQAQLDSGEVVALATQAADGDLIQAAIRQLDAADVSLWLKDGRPKTEAVSAVAGFAVSAAERDTAWAAVSAA